MQVKLTYTRVSLLVHTLVPCTSCAFTLGDAQTRIFIIFLYTLVFSHRRIQVCVHMYMCDASLNKTGLDLLSQYGVAEKGLSFTLFIRAVERASFLHFPIQ